jgi:microcystin-dependent protein
MVPFTVVEYYGAISGNFDVSGAGVGLFEKIYLCNGNNGTPDKRGRVGVGATTGMGGGPLNPAVDPAVSGNPAYSLGGAVGANTVVLTTPQIPAHSHGATAVSTAAPHNHTIAFGNPVDANETGSANTWVQTGTGVNYTTSSTTVTVNTSVSVASAGGGLGHPNFQPGLGCYYIMYIP